MDLIKKPEPAFGQSSYSDSGYSTYGYNKYGGNSYSGCGGGYNSSNSWQGSANSYSNKQNYENYNKTSTMHSYADDTNNYASKTSANVSSNLQDLMVKKLNNQKSKFDDYTVGTQVLHPKFGVGTIINAHLGGASPDVTINFGSFGNKTLSLSMAPLQILKKSQ
jgi:DNA helicase-2/ATP-dependent DNA helicase PcrA